eukprot:scaffold50691_cov60-Phaeocystis_antarctica.AAC.3
MVVDGVRDHVRLQREEQVDVAGAVRPSVEQPVSPSVLALLSASLARVACHHHVSGASIAVQAHGDVEARV